MGPGASTYAQPLSRLLLSLPKPCAARLPRSSSSPSQPRPDVAAARSPGLVLRRREAAAALLSTAFLSRFAPPAAAPTHAPREWLVQGSGDRATWATLDSRADQPFPTLSIAYTLEKSWL